MQIVFTFLDQDLFIVNISWAGAYYLYAGTPSLEPKHETYTHKHRSCQPAASRWSIGSHFWVWAVLTRDFKRLNLHIRVKDVSVGPTLNFLIRR
jgi:hypothetical protein